MFEAGVLFGLDSDGTFSICCAPPEIVKATNGAGLTLPFVLPRLSVAFLQPDM